MVTKYMFLCPNGVRCMACGGVGDEPDKIEHYEFYNRPCPFAKRDKKDVKQK